MLSVNKGLLCLLISRETWNKLFPIKNGARPPAAAFSGTRVAFPGRVAAAGSHPALLGTPSPCPSLRARPCTPGQNSSSVTKPLSAPKLQIHLHETEPAQCQETDKASAKSQPSEGIKQLLEERHWLNKVQQMMPINKFSIIKGHPGSQKQSAKSCNHTILQYPLQKVEKLYFGWKRTHRADYLRKLQPATKTSLSAFYLREWGCISGPISYFRWIISLNYTAVICLHVLLWHHYSLLSLTLSETDNLWGLLMGQFFPWICLYL